jgi:hypothetical protein
MTEILLEAFRHHAWANKQLLAACRGRPHEQLTLPGTAAGTDRGILAIFNHITQTDRGYGSRRGERPDWAENEEDTPTWTSSNGAPRKTRRSGSGSSRSRSTRPSSSSWTRGPTRPSRACSSSRRSTTGTPTASRSVPSSPASASSRPTSRPGRTQKPRATRGNDRRRPGSPSTMRRRLLQVVADYKQPSAVLGAGRGQASRPQYPGVTSNGRAGYGMWLLRGVRWR